MKDIIEYEISEVKNLVLALFEASFEHNLHHGNPNKCKRLYSHFLYQLQGRKIPWEIDKTKGFFSNGFEAFSEPFWGNKYRLACQ